MNKLTVSEMSNFWLKSDVSNSRNEININLSDYSFITHSALVSLSSLIEYYLINTKENILITLPTIDDEFSNNYEVLRLITKKDLKFIEDFFRKHSIVLNRDSYFKNYLRLKFMSFLNHSGFIDMWKSLFSEGRVEFINYQNTLVGNHFKYMGRIDNDDYKDNQYPHREYIRYTQIKRISGDPRERKSVIEGMVNSLTAKLPDSQKKSPLFNDNEFHGVFLEQLSDNVASHTGGTGAYVIARSFSQEDILYQDQRNFLFPEFDDALKKICIANGFFEINISDIGSGIDKTLDSAYEYLLKKIFHTNLSYKPQDVIAFSLDEFGSRYLSKNDKFKSLIDGHSLNRILKYTIKYGGHLRILSNDNCLNYDTNKLIKRGNFDLGFEGEPDKKIGYQKGLNIRVILPHTRSYNCNYPKAKHIKWNDELPDFLTVPHAIYIGIELQANPKIEEIDAKVSEITQRSTQKRIDKLVIDFSGTDSWDVNIFLYVVEKLENLSSKLSCWGINVPKIIIDNIGSSLNKQENKKLPFICLDNTEDKNIYFISKETFNVSKGLSLLVKDQVDDKGRKILEARSLEDIKYTIRKLDKIDIEDEELDKILSHSFNLFYSNKVNKTYTGIITYSEMVNSSVTLLQEHFKELLIKTNSIYTNDKSDKRTCLYRLPSSNKIVYEYLWTYNLLQYGHHTEEISVKIKNAFSNFYTNMRSDYVSFKKVDAIVCVTAPAMIIAEALSRKFTHSPDVIDIGGVSNLDPDDILKKYSSQKKSKCIIVTDVIDTEKLVKRIIKLLEYKNFSVIGITALIKFVDGENGWDGTINEVEYDLGSKKTVIPFQALYNYTKPKEFDGSIDIKKHKLYLIEPYSLRPTLSDILYDTFYAWEPVERERFNPKKIAHLDKKGCIIKGHFRDRIHHNKIMVNMPKALSDNDLSNWICADIIDFINNRIPSVIVVPLHSNIHFLVPKLKIKIREKGYNVPIICTITVDLKGRGPFYILPEEVKNILLKVKLSNRVIMFLDDGVLTGRTVETFYRAISQFTRRNPSRRKRKLNSILIYCIVNRLGRAAATKWRETTHVQNSTNFEFREFVKIECPVYTSSDCPICQHINRLKEYLKNNAYREKRIQRWVEKQLILHEATIVNSSEFINTQINKLPKSYSKSNFMQIDKKPTVKRNQMTNDSQLNLVGKPTITTFEGCIWWLWERSYRGAPSKYLLSEFYEWVKNSKNLKRNQKEYLFHELLLWSLDNIDDFKTHGNWKINILPELNISEDLLLYYKTFSEYGSKLLPSFLERCVNTVLTRSSRESSMHDVVEIYKLSIQAIKPQDNVDRVLNITLGIYLIIVVLNQSNKLRKLKDKLTEESIICLKKDDKWKEHYENIIQFLEAEYTPDDYIYSLRLLCQERHKKRHPFLFKIKSKELEKATNVKEYLGFFIDYLPYIKKSIDIAFQSERKLNNNLDTEIKNFNNNIRDAIRLIESVNCNQLKEKIREKLEGAEHYLKDDTVLGELIDVYHPNIYQILYDLMIKENKKFKVINLFDCIKIIEPSNRNLCLIGYKGLLVDTIKNNTIGVLKDWYDKGEKNIGIRIINENSKSVIKIYYSYFDRKSGHKNIDTGTSFSMYEDHWLRYGGEIIRHRKSDIAGYKSYITIKALMGFNGGDYA